MAHNGSLDEKMKQRVSKASVTFGRLNTLYGMPVG